ncbi:GDSL-type esterase/lipase family protein [Ruminococcus sp. NK3A76]|uniref:GDSL-type esterase/lipase family protein n=1 Tax=Ruminococcus sp. NK3A76 TaxID=877411 RepID=UPI00048EAFBD|nr:GDSL-type esterase/lipase family protein [Ruminococcus sp. NK3A76]
MKKIICAALSLIMAMSATVSAFAQTGEDYTESLPVIEITPPEYESGAEDEPVESGKAAEIGSNTDTTTTTTTAKKTTTSKVTTTTKKTTTTPKTTTTKATTTTTAKKVTAKTVRLTQNIVLYKGEKKKLDIVGASKGKVTVKTGNKKVVAVNGITLTAKKSGSTKVTITVKSDKNTYIVTANVTVKVSSYDSSVKYDQTKTSSKQKLPAVVWHKEVVAGKKFTLKLSGYDKVSFTSSEPSIASVTSKGVVTARKAGRALIKAKVKAGRESYTFYTRVHVITGKAAPTVTQQQINTFFGASGFIGSSIGVGQQMYFNSQGYNFLGHPAMMVRGCYAFHNDGGANGSQYQISYGGYTGPARYVVQHSGVKRVFINMGTNDMVGSADYVFNNYVNYITGIRATNPNVPIYIEAMTPVYAGGQRGNLNNANVNALNAKLAAYCKTQSDMYYIDINTPLKAGTGALPAAYSSDSYVHLTAAAYAVWTNVVVDYVSKQMIAEQRAKDAVQTYTESKTSANKTAAKKALSKLESSALKTKLLKKLK